MTIFPNEKPSPTFDVDFFVEEGDVGKLQEALKSLDPVPERVGVVQLEVGVDLESKVRLQGAAKRIKYLGKKLPTIDC